MLSPARPPNTFVGDDGKQTPYPTPDPTLAGDPDGRARPTAATPRGSPRRCRPSSSPTTAPTPTNDPANARRPTSRSSRATPTARSSTSSARSSSTARRSTTPPSACSSTQRPVGGQPQLRRRGHRRLRRDQPAPVRRGPRRCNQFAFVLDGYVLSAPSMNASSSTASPQHHGQLHAGDARRPSPTSSSTARCRSASRCSRSDTDLGDARLAAAADRPHRRPHRSRPRRDLLADRLPRARLRDHRVARRDGRAHLPHDLHPGVAHGLPPVARRRRGPDRHDRLHGGLVHRVLRAHPRRAARRQVDHGAVEDGWGRAKRTIYISKSINILAAVVLYILADAPP